MPRFGAVELGGSKVMVAVADDPTRLSPTRIVTTGPAETLDAVRELLTAPLDGLGVASFGPIGVTPGRTDYGRVGNTPKDGWSGFDLLEALGGPEWPTPAIDTDVNAAALAEAALGAGTGHDQVAYVTVGTGIGAGLAVTGRSLRGHPHPELGHTVVSPREDDRFPGACPYHRKCLEGMVSGPALGARFGSPPEDLGNDSATEARDLVCHYLAQGLRNLVYAWAPDLIVVGGGVSHMTGFHDCLRVELVDQLAGYPGGPVPMVVPPELANSGLTGAYMLSGGPL